METIFATAFGRVIDIQNGQSNKLTEAASNVFSNANEQKKSSLVFFLVILSKWTVYTCFAINIVVYVVVQATFPGLDQ